MTDKNNGVPSRGNGNGAGPEQGFDRWLNRQLHRLYDPVLAEAVPDEIMRLLHEFDHQPAPGDLPAETRAKPRKAGGG